MNNKYENNLRTHYTPLKRSKYYKPNNSFILNKSKGNCKKELKLDISYNDNHKQAKYRNQTPINSNILSRNKTFFDYNNEKTLDINLIKKEKLNKSFNKIHPYYFQDKLQLIEKEKINEKIKNRMSLQREALKQLTIYKVNNPSKKEILQKINELSYNPLISYQPKSPLYKKTISNYYYNDNIIKKIDINRFNKPRKEIEEYYNKCQYQIPTVYGSDTTIHTKAKYIFPNVEKNKFEKEIKDEIIKQRNKKYKLNEINYDEILRGKIKNKLYNDLNTYIKNNEKRQKLSKEKEVIMDNNLLTEYNQYVKNHINDGEKDCYNKIKTKMEKEDKQKDLEKKTEILKTRKILNDWSDMYKIAKNKKNNEKLKEKKLWRNYSETFEINYNKPKNKFFKRCCRCGNNYSKDNIVLG
jgi:hypothetical protein